MLEGLRLDDQLCFALHAASRAMTGAYAPLLEELEVTYPQYLVLLVLWEEEGVRVSRIGERLYLDSATLTPLLKRLETRGIVERRRNVEDERVVEIFLTAAGKKLQKKALGVAEGILCRMQITLPELARLRDELKSLTKKLQSGDLAPAEADPRAGS